jgi:hypothetical protein
VDCRNDAKRESSFLEINLDRVLDGGTQSIDAWFEIEHELLVGHEVNKIEPQRILLHEITHKLITDISLELTFDCLQLLIEDYPQLGILCSLFESFLFLHSKQLRVQHIIIHIKEPSLSFVICFSLQTLRLLDAPILTLILDPNGLLGLRCNRIDVIVCMFFKESVGAIVRIARPERRCRIFQILS